MIWEKRRESIEKYFAGTREELEEKVEESLHTQYKKLFMGILLGVIFLVCFLVSILLQPSKITVERDAPGGEESSQVLELKNKDKDTTFELWIPPKVLTKAEKKKAFQSGFSILEKQLKGKNTSINKVEEDLSFPSSIPENPCLVSWDTSDLGVIDTSGHVYSNKVKKPIIMDVIATLSYEKEKQSKIFHVCVIPNSKQQSKLAKVKNKIKALEKNSRTKTSFTIPKKVLGFKVSIPEDQKNQFPILCIFVVFAVGLLWYSEEEKQKQNAKRSYEISMEEYPNIVSEFVLLLGAGMTIQGVIHTIAEEEKGSEKYVYQQIVQADHQLGLGMEPTKILRTFGEQMGIASYGKLSTMMIRSLTRGSADLLERLKEEESTVFLERKEIARRKGEEASTKLLLPMMLMLLVVLVLLMFPAFLSFSM